ncbi:MAG: flagellar biosynthetic protein FliO [bacterium]|nr:flagellar biosynthetic protein FliO [bacterium]
MSKACIRYSFIIALLISLSSNAFCEDTIENDIQTPELQLETPGEIRAKTIAGLIKERKVQKAEGLLPAHQKEASTGSSILRMIEGLVLVAGIFLVGVHLYKKFVLKDKSLPNKFRGRRIKIIERTPISSKASLLLVEIEGKKVLVGVGSENVSITELESNEIENISGFDEGVDQSCENAIKISA